MSICGSRSLILSFSVIFQKLVRSIYPFHFRAKVVFNAIGVSIGRSESDVGESNQSDCRSQNSLLQNNFPRSFLGFTNREITKINKGEREKYSAEDYNFHSDLAVGTS